MDPDTTTRPPPREFGDGRVVRDFDVEFLFEGHDQLDIVQAVRAEVIDEAGLFGDLFRVSVEVLDHDLTDAFENVGHTL